MNLFHIFLGNFPINCYLLFLVFPCVLWILMFITLNRYQYSNLIRKKIKKKCKLPKQLYAAIHYIRYDSDQQQKKLIHRKSALFYYLKRTIYFLHNYKYQPLKCKLRHFFIRNSVPDIRNIKYLTYKKVIDFKKDMNVCLMEAYNSFNYKNKRELLYIYFTLYSKIFYFFKNENIYFLHFLTHVILVAWVYTPSNALLHQIHIHDI